VYLIQASPLFGKNDIHLPYAVGCLAAYAWQNPIIQAEYILEPFQILRTPIREAAAAIQEPYLVAFSNYVWNYEYHKALAAAVKRLHPACIIVFGGHQIPNDGGTVLEELPFADILLRGAGEVSFAELLLALLSGRPLSEVPGCSYRGTGAAVLHTPLQAYPSQDYPSPYLKGYLDALFDTYPALNFSMTLETNRGCPYQCSYCDWGTERQKLTRFPMERIQAEIDWAAAHRISFVFCADANFGIFPRDEEIVDYIIACKSRCGYPEKFSVCLAKDSSETVLHITKKLNDSGLTNGAVVSFQTLNPEALQRICRSNMPLNSYAELISAYNTQGIPVCSELILGLPGETLDSFRKGMGALLSAGLRGPIEVYSCELLPNSEMAQPDYIRRHGIQAAELRQIQRHSSPGDMEEIPEKSTILCATKTMSVTDWAEAFVFANAVQAFHCYGLMTNIAVYIHWEQGVAYEEMYGNLTEDAKSAPGTLLHDLVAFLTKRYAAVAKGKGECMVWHDPKFGEICWPLGEALFLLAAFEAERFYAELPQFLRRYKLDEALLQELIRYQAASIHLPQPQAEEEVYAFAFPAYFRSLLTGNAVRLLKTQTIVRYEPRSEQPALADYARDYLWYGRKSSRLIRKELNVCYA
jgi:putative methyltransferase